MRAKLLSKQQAMERSEKAKKQREMKKYGKKVCITLVKLLPIPALQTSKVSYPGSVIDRSNKKSYKKGRRKRNR